MDSKQNVGSCITDYTMLSAGDFQEFHEFHEFQVIPPGRRRGRSVARRAVMEAVAFCFMLRSNVGGSCSTCTRQEVNEAQQAIQVTR